MRIAISEFANDEDVDVQGCHHQLGERLSRGNNPGIVFESEN
jgi:hypothetical protein